MAREEGEISSFRNRRESAGRMSAVWAKSCRDRSAVPPVHGKKREEKGKSRLLAENRFGMTARGRVPGRPITQARLTGELGALFSAGYDQLDEILAAM